MYGYFGLLSLTLLSSFDCNSLQMAITELETERDVRALSPSVAGRRTALPLLLALLLLTPPRDTLDK